jgi:hypothetical protein
VEVQPSKDQFVSPFFLVTNKDATRRPILNVRTINREFLPKQHFKMETLALILPLIKKGEWFASWDLRKGYFNIALHPDFQRFFCFDWEGKRYQFTCLVMGLSLAPWLFTKLMNVLVQLARCWGIQVSFYIDDSLIRGQTPDSTRADTLLFGNLLQQAGFLLNESKSVAEPTQRILHLGFIVDSVEMEVSLPQEKEDRLRKAAQRALKMLNEEKVTTIRAAAQTIGLIVSCLMASTYGQNHYRTLERAKDVALQRSHGNFDAPFVWPRECEDDLKWWIHNAFPVKTTFAPRQPSTTLITDASLQGWGAIWGEKEIFGAWEEQEEQIDELELLTVLLALETWNLAQNHETILLRCDNTVAVAYVNHKGGKIDRLDAIARKIWCHLEHHGSFMIAAYIATNENPADALTRGVTSNAQLKDIEVQLNPESFRFLLNQGPFRPVIDWFASSVNAQLNRFYSWKPEPAAEGIDAFSFFWGEEPGYIFPPFCLIPRILQKIQEDHAQVLMIHPDWPGALWGPSLEKITTMRVRLASSSNLLKYPENPNLRHPMRNLRLVASWLDGALQTSRFGER